MNTYVANNSATPEAGEGHPSPGLFHSAFMLPNPAGPFGLSAPAHLRLLLSQPCPSPQVPPPYRPVYHPRFLLSPPSPSFQAPPLTVLSVIQGPAPHCPVHHPRFLLSPPCPSSQAPPRPRSSRSPRGPLGVVATAPVLPPPSPPHATVGARVKRRGRGLPRFAAVCRALHHGKSEHHARTSELRGGGRRRGGIPARPLSSCSARALAAACATLGLNRNVSEPKPEARRVGQARGACPRAPRRPWG